MIVLTLLKQPARRAERIHTGYRGERETHLIAPMFARDTKTGRPFWTADLFLALQHLSRFKAS